MVVFVHPFAFYAKLKNSTLTNKIRQKSWNLDNLFPKIKETKAKVKRLGRSIKSNKSDIPELQHQIELLAAEIRKGIGYLKFINYYDSALFFLYFRWLQRIFEICEVEHARLMEELKQSAEGKRSKESIGKTKDDVENKVRGHEELIKQLSAGERQLIKDDRTLIRELRSIRWYAEKLAQHEFSLLKFTFRSMENLNRKIKVEAIKVKKDVPEEAFLIKRIQKGNVNPQFVKRLANLLSRAIDEIRKDVVYSFKLISKFEREMDKLKKDVENLKKPIKKSVKEEQTANEMVKPWDDAVRYAEEEVNEDLMHIFRNIFVLYKRVGTDQIEKAA